MEPKGKKILCNVKTRWIFILSLLKWILLILGIFYEDGYGFTKCPLGCFKFWTSLWCENHIVPNVFDVDVGDHKFFGEVCPTSQCLCVWFCGCNENLPRWFLQAVCGSCYGFQWWFVLRISWVGENQPGRYILK